MTKDTAIIERFRDELGALRHAAGQLVPKLRERKLSEADRQTLIVVTKARQELREALAILAAGV